MRPLKWKGVGDLIMKLAYFTERPYGLLLITAIVLSIALVFIPIGNIDLQNKTMFSIPLAFFVWIIPLLLIFFWLLSLLAKRVQYSTTLMWTHILASVLTTILTVVILYIVLTPSSSIYFTSSEGGRQLIGNAIRFVFIVFVCGQFTYFINVLLGLFVKKRNSLKKH